MGLLASFIGRYPGVRVTVAMGNSQSVLRDLVEYRTDVAVVARIDDDRRFHAVSLTNQPVVRRGVTTQGGSSPSCLGPESWNTTPMLPRA